MWWQIIILAALITGVVLKLGKMRKLCVTEKFRDRTYSLTEGALGLYLTDYLLLLVFDTPIPLLHEPSWSGIVCSLLLIIIAVMNILCGLDRGTIESEDDGQQTHLLTVFFGSGICVYWLIIEIAGLLLKVNP